MRLIGYRREYSDISKIYFFSENQGPLHTDCTMAHHVIHNKLVISSGRWCHLFFIEYNWEPPEATVKAIKTESNRYPRYEGEAAYETMDFAPDLPSSLRHTLLLPTFLI